MKKNKLIFIIAFALFMIAVIYIAIDMASNTAAPWNKKKNNLQK